MKKSIKLFALLTIFIMGNTSCAKAQKNYTNDNPAYIIYNSSGKKVSYGEMLKSVSGADILLFGELHNDVMSHWLELQLTKDLHNLKKEKLVIGAEMWEADNQLVLDEMMNSEYVDLNTYIESSVLWHNFKNDYLPVLKYAKDNDLRFVATNIPRRYARIVSKRGEPALDSLSAQAKSYIAPLPIHMDLKDEFYTYIADVFKETQQNVMTGSSLTNFVKAQIVKDATMAHFIVKNLPEKGYFFHFNGELHSAFNSGIGYYIKHYNPKLKFKTISVIKKSNVFDFKSKESRADFNILVPENMSISYGN